MADHLPDIDFDKMQSRAQYYDEDFEDDRDKEGDVLYLDPKQIADHIPGFEFGEAPLPKDMFDEKEQMTILNPKLDYIKKRQGAGGAIPLDK